MEHLHNSFPNYIHEKFDHGSEIGYEEKFNTSAFNLNFIKYYEQLENINVNSVKENSNFSPTKKKNSLDISYSIEQTFCENSNINIEEELNNEETCNI